MLKGDYSMVLLLLPNAASRRMTMSINGSTTTAVLLHLLPLRLLVRLATTSVRAEARVGGGLKPAERHMPTRERRAAREERVELWQVRRGSFREDV